MQLQHTLSRRHPDASGQLKLAQLPQVSLPAAQQLLDLAPELLQLPRLLQAELRWLAQPGVSTLNMALAKLADGQVGRKSSCFHQSAV